MITVRIDPTVADFLRATHDLTADTFAAIQAGSRKATTGPRGETLIRWEFTCPREQAVEIKAWLSGFGSAIRQTNEEFSGELLKAEHDIAAALLGAR